MDLQAAFASTAIASPAPATDLLDIFQQAAPSTTNSFFQATQAADPLPSGSTFQKKDPIASQFLSGLFTPKQEKPAEPEKKVVDDNDGWGDFNSEVQPQADAVENDDNDGWGDFSTAKNNDVVATGSTNLIGDAFDDILGMKEEVVLKKVNMPDKAFTSPPVKQDSAPQTHDDFRTASPRQKPPVELTMSAEENMVSIAEAFATPAKSKK